MKFLSSFLSSVLFASKTTWYIDGNNLMGHKGTPRDRDSIANKLRPVQDATSDLNVILVWDGRRGQDEVMVETENEQAAAVESILPSATMFQVVSLAEGMSTDDYILEQLQEMKAKADTVAKHASVQVVTADRALRRKVLATKPVVRGVVNPVVFWRRYRPRLTGMKSDYANEPKVPVE